MISSASREHFKEQRNSVSNALFSRTVRTGIAAMHNSFRALHQQSLLTSLACRQNYRLAQSISSQILPAGHSLGVLQNNFQSVFVPHSYHYNNSVVNHCISRHQNPVSAFCSNLPDFNKHLAVGQVKCGYPFPQQDYLENINAEREQFLETLSVLSQVDMPKRKRSHSEHSSRSQRKSSKKERSGSSSSRKLSKTKKKCDEHVTKSKVVTIDHESKHEIDEFISSMRRQSKGDSSNTDSASTAKSSRIDSVASALPAGDKHDKHNAQSKGSKEKPKTSRSEAQIEQQSHRTRSLPSGWSEFAQMNFSTTSAEKKQGRSRTPPPDWFSCPQRNFSTTVLSGEQKQNRTHTPPPSWSSFARSNFSTTTPSADQEQDRISGSAASGPGSGRKLDLFEFRRHWRDSSLGRRHKSKPYPGVEFVVMSYNLLAQNLIHMNEYLYRNCPRYVLDWNFRKHNLMMEIANINSDIVCLQEVQNIHYTSFYEPEMYKLGYRGLFKQRTGDKQDGCATFYKSSRFDLINYKLLEYRRPGIPMLDRDNVAVVMLLRPKGPCHSERICVANTHLLYNPKRGDIKLTQLGLLLAEIDKLAFIPNGQNDSRRYHPVVMCGDFNSVPQSSLVDFVQTSTLNYDGLKAVDVSGQEPWKSSRYLSCPLWPGRVGVTEKCQYESVCQQRHVHDGAGAANQTSVSENNSSTASDTTLTNDPHSRTHSRVEQNSPEEDNPDFSSHLEHPFNFASSYHYNKDSKEVTTNHGKTNCTVDYIFHSSEVVCQKKDTNQLRVLSRLSLFTDEEASDMGGLPNARWSSDHFSLAVKFLLTPNDVGAKKK